MEELKKIKKMYGENFMKLCRRLFPTLLETEGRLSQLLELYFANNSRTLYEDITKNGLESSFKNFIYSKVDVESPDKKIIEEKTPYELLDEAGYKLIECKNEQDIQKFKKYYKSGEELCTFEGGRLKNCYVFFAVRKDVKNIKREDFNNPKREDEYGTSVMSIQFNKEGICTVSIKNRYNHRVNNPDATYGNDLEKIAPGLTQSFGKLLKQRGLTLDSGNVESFEIPNYVVASNGKYYKYNMEVNGAYYCPGNIIIDRISHKIPNPEKYLLIETYLLDLEDKKIQSCVKNSKRDGFLDNLQDIEKIHIENNKEKGTKVISVQKKGQDKPIRLETDKDNKIIGYEDYQLTSVGDRFLPFNKSLRRLIAPNVTQIGNDFLLSNEALRKLELPSVTKIGNDFLSSNGRLEKLEVPNVTNIRNNFLPFNEKLEKLETPKLTDVGYSFLDANENLRSIQVPSLNNVEDPESFLPNNKGLTQIEMPNIEGLTERLFKTVKKNRIKNVFKKQKQSEVDKDSDEIEVNSKQEEPKPVDENKYEQIYGKSRGRIGRVFDKLKSFISREGQNHESSQEHEEEIE